MRGFFVILSKNIGKLFVALSNDGTIMHSVDLSAKLFEYHDFTYCERNSSFLFKERKTMQSHTVVHDHSEAQFSSTMQTNRKLLLLKMINY